MERKKKDLWSHDVHTKWHPPAGFFEQSPEEIAQGLVKASNSLEQAMSRLDFYINRSGTRLTDQRKAALEKAKTIIDDLCNKQNDRKQPH